MKINGKTITQTENGYSLKVELSRCVEIVIAQNEGRPLELDTIARFLSENLWQVHISEIVRQTPDLSAKVLRKAAERDIDFLRTEYAYHCTYTPKYGRSHSGVQEFREIYRAKMASWHKIMSDFESECQKTPGLCTDPRLKGLVVNIEFIKEYTRFDVIV